MENHSQQPIAGQQPHQSEDERLFSDFDSYPWKADSVFLTGLIALLGGVDKLRPDPSHADLAVHARIFYYQQARNARVDFSAYKQWATASTERNGTETEVLPALYWAREQISALDGIPPANAADAVAAVAQQYVPPPPDPAWQQAAPAQPLRVSHESAGGDGGTGAAPYPAHFAELIAAVQNNQPVPGVREIPDTVIRDSNVKPVGKMTAPKKPWELGRTSSTEAQGGQALQHDATVDQDFPPIDGQAQAQTSGEQP
ncbi:hypothetical protein PspLS_00804 [Pyricularia sp. CBS 133598]|nr:hypothetical protein PspLS_00804 [Pyricularia sp. CBS 133598]